MDVEKMLRSVFDELGPGHRENVYQKALEVELRMNSIPYECERVVPVIYKGHVVSHVRLDLVIDGLVIVELKSIKTLKECDENQIKRYLVNSEMQKGVLVNFGTDGNFEFKEFVNPTW